MIDNISIQNFKCFESIDLSLGMLNIFSGINGMGKSTAIQSLLLVKQSQEQYPSLQYLILNGDYTTLGVGKDILYENADKDEITFTFNDKSGELIIKASYEAESDILNADLLNSSIIESLKSDFEYINAGRLSPQTVYEKSSLYVNNKFQLGIFGQYTAHYLAIHQDDPVEEDGKSYTLKDLTQRWLDKISPNIKLNIKTIPNTDLAQINYYYTQAPTAIKTAEYRPTNVGFGISYVLPVITALLKANSGDILIIENPEAHLHPHGQLEMGELIARSAARGVQIFIETHSDHVLNGIRIGVKNHLIHAEATKLFFFEAVPEDGKIKHIAQTPQILPDGRLDFWPDGFFDEWEKALDQIIY